MKRSNILWALLNSLFLVVFNFLFFRYVNIANAGGAVWVSYGFIHFAYALLLLTPYLVREGKADYIYRRPLYGIPATYFIFQVILGLGLILNVHVREVIAARLSENVESLSFAMGFIPTSTSFAVVSQVILAGIFVALLLINLLANEHTAERVAVREEELKYVKISSSQVKGILQQITDKQVAKKVEKLYDVIHASPVKSCQSVRPLEEEIINDINHLDDAASQNDLQQVEQLATKLTRLAQERNRKLRT
jgi:hypothetical protein